jgi:hypothetical protein
VYLQRGSCPADTCAEVQRIVSCSARPESNAVCLSADVDHLCRMNGATTTRTHHSPQKPRFVMLDLISRMISKKPGETLYQRLHYRAFQALAVHMKGVLIL